MSTTTFSGWLAAIYNISRQVKQDSNKSDKSDPARMQSSPPTRAHAQSPSSTQYSIDLAALDPHSGSSTPVAERHISKLLSDDINGPSDFTLNMANWINGGRERERERSVLEEIDGPSDFTLNMDRYLDTAQAIRKRSQDAMTSNSISEPSSPTTARATPTSRPEQAPRRGSLQATVEDYQSELDLGRPSSPTISHIPSPVVTGTPITHIPSPLITRTATIPKSFGSSLAKQMESLKARCEELERMNQELQRRMDETINNNKRQAQELQKRNEAFEQALRSGKEARETEKKKAAKREAELVEKLQFMGQERHDTMDETRRLDYSVQEAQDRLKMLEQVLGAERKARASEKQEAEEREAEFKEHHAWEIQAMKNKMVEKEKAQAAEKRETEELEIELRNQRAREIQAITKKMAAQERAWASERRQAEDQEAELKTQHAREIEMLKQQMATQVKAHEAEKQRITQENEEMNAAMDVRISAAVKKRALLYKEAMARKDEQMAEKEMRLEELQKERKVEEKERKVMARELMRAWGREEFGDTGAKQKYRYKYA